MLRKQIHQNGLTMPDVSSFRKYEHTLKIIL